MASLNYEDTCNSSKANLMNERIYDRNIPSHVLQPYLSVRPVETKYTVLPIVDPRAPINVPLKQQPIYNSERVFNPGNRMSPWSGYVANVNLESELRNQVFALQYCSQAVYVPSSSSDMYPHTFKLGDKQKYHQPFPDLFAKESFSPFNPNPQKIGNELFQNHTRQQLKEISSRKDYTGEDNCG
jgi:hypothetical protein